MAQLDGLAIVPSKSWKREAKQKCIYAFDSIFQYVVSNIVYFILIYFPDLIEEMFGWPLCRIIGTTATGTREHLLQCLQVQCRRRLFPLFFSLKIKMALRIGKSIVVVNL